MQGVLLVALGSAAGGVARYLIAVLWLRAIGAGFPWETLLVNALGSALIGFLAISLPANDSRLLLMTGVLGGFTTFSSFSLQTVELMRAGAAGAALIYILLSVTLCVGGAALGLWLGLHTSR